MRTALDTISRTLELSADQVGGVSCAWTEDTLARVASSLSKDSLETFIETLLMWQFPKGKLPFAREPKPFQSIGRTAIVASIKHALTFPEQDGRLVNAVRDVLGINHRFPREFTLIEAHIDISHVDDSLRDGLIRLGFQPDDFVKLEPACYKRHFTLAYRVPSGRSDRVRTMKSAVEKRVAEAAKMICSESDASAFIEWEIYGSKWVRKYSPFRVVKSDGLSHFPYDERSFHPQRMPSTNEQAIAYGVPLDARKLADVHVKLPTGVREKECPGASSADMQALRDCLLRARFYEIVSEAGNAIFTGQFFEVSEALSTFVCLDNFCRQYGGFVDLVVEVCLGFWRREEKTNGCATLAEVSNLLVPAGV